MIDPALLAKIRKCFALGASPNEHEAAAALAKARELMAAHGLSEEDLAMAEFGEAAARGSRTQKPATWERLLCAAVRRALNVEVFLDEHLDRRYVGRGPAPEIAAYAFKVLFAQLKKARQLYMTTKLKRVKLARKRVRADAFCEGWVLAIYRKIAALAPARERDPMVDCYLAERHGEMVVVPSRGGTAVRTEGDYWRGLDAGRSVDLHHGVGGSAGLGRLT